MRLKLSDIYNLADGLKQIVDKELETAAAFKVQFNYRKVGDELKTGEEVRKNIVDKYKQYTDDRGIFTEENEDKKVSFQKEVEELMEQEVELQLKHFKLSDFGETIQPRILVLLEKLIEEEK